MPDLEANWPFMPFAGIGTSFHITDHWVINASYMKVLETTIGDVYKDENSINYHYHNGRFEIGIDVFTLGIQYYF